MGTSEAFISFALFHPPSLLISSAITLSPLAGISGKCLFHWTLEVEPRLPCRCLASILQMDIRMVSREYYIGMRSKPGYFCAPEEPSLDSKWEVANNEEQLYQVAEHMPFHL